MTDFLTAAPALIIGLLFTLLVLLFLSLMLSGKYRPSLWFLLASLVPALWFALPVLLRGYEPSGTLGLNYVDTLRNGFRSWFWMPIMLWFLIFLVFVWSNPRSFESHGEIVAPRKAVWTVFGLVMLGIALWVPYNVLNVSRQASGLHAAYVNLIDAINETQDYASRLEDAARDETMREKRPGLYRDTIASRAADIEAQSNVLTMRPAVLSQSLANQLQEEDNPDNGRRGDAVADEQKASQVLAALGQVESLGGEIAIHSREVISAAAGLPTVIAETDTSRIIFLADEINDIASDLEPIGAVLALDQTSPFSIIMVLFVIFLLIPWMLYLSFMISKRSTLIRNSRTTLQYLGLVNRLIEAPAPQRDEFQQSARVVARELSKAAQEIDRLASDKPDLFTAGRVWSGADWSEGPAAAAGMHIGVALEATGARPEAGIGAKEAGARGAGAHRALDDGEGRRLSSSLLRLSKEFRVDDGGVLVPVRDNYNPEVIRHIVEAARDEALESIIRYQRFHSREYIIPLVILTLLTAVGWYYTYLPDALAGLTQLVLDGATLQRVTEYLTTGFTPITMTFAGAWLFIVVMLMNRWAQDDLYPRSFFYAALRLVVAFLVGLLFAQWFEVAGNNSTFILLLAFAVGAAPFEFINAVLRSIGKMIQERRSPIGSQIQQGIIQDFSPPEWGSKHRLTDLEDLTVSDDVRFYQEGIKSVHSLATADLDRLVLNTPFDAQQLVDWVDQALLYIHAKDLWRPGLSAICIRTASELVEFCTAGAASGDTINDARVTQIVSAFNEAQTAGSQAGGVSSTIQEAVDGLKTAAKTLESRAAALLETAGSVVADKPAGDDKVKLLRQQIGDKGLKGALDEVKTKQSELNKQIEAVIQKENQAQAQARQGVAQLAESVKGVDQKATAALKALEQQAPDKTEGLAETLAAINDAAKSAGSLASTAVTTAVAAGRAMMPYRLSESVLQIMLAAMIRDPNIGHVRNFWRARMMIQ